MEEASLSPHILMHAFAAGRWRASGNTGANAPQIVAFSGTKSVKVKTSEADRKAFKQLFPLGSIPPTETGDWGDFIAWIDGKAVTRSSGPFTDKWLLAHLHEHQWLGNAWRVTEDEGLILAIDQGAPTRLGRAFDTKPSLNIAFAVKMATPFLPPAWPEGSLEIIKIALLEAVTPAALLLKEATLLAALLTTDPLELDYPLILDTN
jgi:hypothetical protein